LPLGSSTNRRTREPALSTTYLVPIGKCFGRRVLEFTFLSSGFGSCLHATMGYSVAGLRPRSNYPHAARPGRNPGRTAHSYFLSLTAFMYLFQTVPGLRSPCLGGANGSY